MLLAYILNMKNPLKKIREHKSISRPNFCRKTGMPYATAYHIESGLGRSLSADTLQTVSEFSGQKPEQIQSDYKAWREELKTTIE